MMSKGSRALIGELKMFKEMATRGPIAWNCRSMADPARPYQDCIAEDDIVRILTAKLPCYHTH